MESINIAQEIRWGDWYFKDHVIPPDFDYRVHKKELSPYYERRGFKASMMYSDYYSRLNGKPSDRYMPMDVYFFYALPCLNRWDLRLAYTDKNVYSELFPNVRQPETVVKNINGLFFDGGGCRVSASDAALICSRESGSCIIKPTLDTCNGNGVALFDSADVRTVEAQFAHYGVNFIVQRKVAQHLDMSKLNDTSLNSLRIFTYRDQNRELHHLYTFLRFGGKGSVVDNSSSGGGFCRVFDDGSICDDLIRHQSLTRHSMKVERGLNGFVIPSYRRAIETVLGLHATLPYFDYIGWDIAVDNDGEPLLIEFNVLANIGMVQTAFGPVFGDYLDEVMDRISVVAKKRQVYSCNSFRPGYKYLLPIG